MAVDTKPNFSCTKFEQCTTDVMNLSGCTQIFGLFDMESGSTFTICDNRADGKILTSSASGVATWELLGTPTAITSTGTSVSSGTTHDHAYDGQTFVSGTEGILVDGENKFYLDDTYITEATLPSLYSFSGITVNTNLGVLPSGQTLGMVYITNTGSSTAYLNLGTTPTGDDITPYQTIQVDPDEDVSVSVNMRLSLTENKTIYLSSEAWTNVALNLQWANITYQNASTTINPGDLPVATPTTIGAISVGTGLSVDGNGHLCATGGTGGGTITGGANGLSSCGENVTLGGALTGSTTICTTGTDIMCIQGVNVGTGLEVGNNSGVVEVAGLTAIDGVYQSTMGATASSLGTLSLAGITASGGTNYNCVMTYNDCIALCHYSGTSACSTKLLMTDASSKFFDDINNKGLEYNGTYKNNFTCHSLVDVDYVTGLTSGGSGGFLGTVTKASAEPTDLQENQWMKPEPMSTDCFNYTFDNFSDSGSTAISVNLSLEDVYLRYCETGTSAGYWIKESYLKPLSSGYTWVGDATCNAAEVVVVNEWVSSAAELCYTGQKFAYDTQTIFQVDVGCCVTMPNKIYTQNINLDTVANTCLFTIPSGKTAMIDSAKLIMLCNASPTSLSVSIGNNACSTASLSYKNMISTHTIDDVSLCEVYDIMPVLGGAACCDGSCCGADVYFRVQSGSTCGNDLCAHLLIEGYVF